MSDDIKIISRRAGEARIDIARSAKNSEDWNKLWQPGKFQFPFKFGDCWKHTVEYKVSDFAAEVGFFIDIIGCKINAFSHDYAMFTGPDDDFFFSIVPTAEGESPTPPGSIRLEFMIENILEIASELETRGINFESLPQPYGKPDSKLYRGHFYTPNGIQVALWGMIQ